SVASSLHTDSPTNCATEPNISPEYIKQKNWTPDEQKFLSSICGVIKDADGNPIAALLAE
ncbi:MAG: hypothetical protein QME60_08940, partial [Verrucomicrobiota bacterium]|nr:hypothetical protein [Verrucomicrobiota bacterium]